MNHAPTPPLPETPKALNDDELYTLIGLWLGPLPFPKNPDYDNWYGGGFGVDMLDDETAREHGANRAWRDQACNITAWFQNTKTPEQVRRTVENFWEQQKEAAQ